MIRVTLINPADRRYWQAQWDDPLTGKTKTRSTKTTIKREAERFAARLEDDLNAGTFRERPRLLFSELKDRYLREVSDTKARTTKLKTAGMFTAVEKHFSPKFTSSFADPNFISEYGTKLRDLGLRPATVNSHLREVRKVLRWAHKLDLITDVPHIELPSPGRMKGRPITTEEFDRMVSAIPKSEMILEQWRDNWRHYLNGLWLSGLRLEESMLLHWSSDNHICVDLSGRRPMFRIQAETDKARQFRLLPMTPDFAEFIAKSPKKDRHGFVFNPFTTPRGGHRKTAHRPTPNHAGRVISDLGRLAKIKVNETKFASAHDFRRAFGQRWAKLVMPAILQALMRHRDIATTMKYYIGSLATDAADAVWAAFEGGNSSGNTSDSSKPTDPQNSTK